MSSTRNTSRTTNSKTTSLNPHHTNGSGNSYDINDSTANLTYPAGNNSEFDPNLQRSSLMRNVSQYDGIYRNARFIHAISSGLVGQQVVIQTSDHERFHGVLETLSPNADIVLTVSHRLDNNNNDIIASPTLPIDLIDTIDSSSQTFELRKRIIKASNIVEIIAVDIDLSGNAKCSLDENPKVSQLEDDRFSRMEHFYGSEDIDPETLEDLDLGDDGKAGFDPEDMFHTNREKFNTTTDFHESKYTNVPVRQMSSTELIEIEKKVQEIERGTRTEDVDEDDAGVKRPSESHNLDDGNSNVKNNRSNRNDFRYDTEYNPSKSDNWREQRPRGMNSNRRGGNNPKQNQYSSTNTRQQYNTRISRNNRYTDNRSPHEGRNSPLQQSNDESTRNQRLNSGNFSQGQTSGPTSPSTTIPARTIYPSTNRPSGNRNSPAPYTGSSSSRNNSTSATSPPSQQQQQLGTNKMAKKPSLNEQQSMNDEFDQPKQQRTTNNQADMATLNRPSQLQAKQQSLSSNTNIPTSATLLNQESDPSSHDPTNTNQSQTSGTITPNSMKFNAGLNPEADEFVPVFPREDSSRPESRDASTVSSLSMGSFVPHNHPQTIQLLQQQQSQQQQQQQMQSQQNQSIIQAGHAQNAAALYQQYYQPPPFATMPQFINANPQQMTVGVMGAQMIPSQSMIATGPSTNNSNNGSSSGMTTPNSSVSAGPTYKTNNNNQGQSGDNGNGGGNNIPPKKAVVSVQRSEQSNAPQQQQQQQQMAGAQQMIFPTGQIRYYSPDYYPSQNPTSMQLPQIPFYYHPMNASGLIQAAQNVGQPQNIMISSANSSGGASGLSSIHYANVYDPRMYSLYSSAAVNPANIGSNWQLARSPPQPQQQQQQQQPTTTEQQQRGGFNNGQNVASQQGSTGGSSNAGNRSTSGAGPTGTGPQIGQQFPPNGPLTATFAYGAPTGWIPGAQPIPSSQANMPSQMNAAYNVIFDPSQQGPPQQATYIHSNSYDAPAYFPPQSQQQSQQQQQPPPQQNLDSTSQSNYNR